MKHLLSEYRQLGNAAAVAVNAGADEHAKAHNDEMAKRVNEEAPEDQSAANMSFVSGYLERRHW